MLYWCCGMAAVTAPVIYSLHVEGVGVLRLLRGAPPVLTARAFCRMHGLGGHSKACQQVQRRLCAELAHRQPQQPGVFLCEAPVFTLRGDWGPEPLLVFGVEDGREVARDFAKWMNIPAHAAAALEAHLCAQDAVLCDPAPRAAACATTEEAAEGEALLAASRRTIALRLRENGAEHKLHARLDEEPTAVARRFCLERSGPDRCNERRVAKAVERALRRALKRAVAREKAEAEEARG